MNKNIPLVQFLEQYRKAAPVSFHVPGHKGGDFFRNLGYGDVISDLVEYDITEIPGADNLLTQDGILGDISRTYEQVYQVPHTLLSVNGSTAGIEAAILSVISESQVLLMGRSSHMAAYRGLRLAGGRAAYLLPSQSPAQEEAGLPGRVLPDELRRGIRENPAARAVYLTNPDYFGSTSELWELVDIAHDAGLPVIVDQAHGSHLILTAPELSAERAGADIIINSTHKTLASFTQSSILHVQGERVDFDRVKKSLELLESTSPSYLLLLSHALNAEIMKEQGKKLAAAWREDLAWVRGALSEIPGVVLFEDAGMDETRIVLRLGALTGADLERRLNSKGIWPEMAYGDWLVLETGIGNVRSDYEKLVSVLGEIGDSIDMHETSSNALNLHESSRANLQPPSVIPVFQEVPKSSKWIPLDCAAGEVAAGLVTPYPPGIPVLCPGEVIGQDQIDYLLLCKASGKTVLGVTETGFVEVGADAVR